MPDVIGKESDLAHGQAAAVSYVGIRILSAEQAARDLDERSEYRLSPEDMDDMLAALDSDQAQDTQDGASAAGYEADPSALPTDALVPSR
ncbi:hypothetical protein [Granulibacter bethesdensis]|uniref:hypothetical protein n=1 Tax=Granulibacter bethesdensis TaxID=364410 RepID=UPI0002EAC85B|nr:hypothetical protein [Granulibacter bethesdensis]